mgnify:FL=1
MNVVLKYNPCPETTNSGLRDYYYGVCLNQISIHDFKTFLNNHPNKESKVVKAYQAMLLFLYANYYIDPFKKWGYFRKGRELLEGLIEQNELNLELRFLRFTIQDNLPSFLGYNSEREIDKRFLFDQIARSIDKDLRERITTYLSTNSITKV